MAEYDDLRATFSCVESTSTKGSCSSAKYSLYEPKVGRGTT